MKIIDCEQGTPVWHQARKGRITASNMRIIMNGHKPSWFKYMAELRGEGRRFSNYAMDRGSRLEKAALARYELAHPNYKTRRVGFVVHETLDFVGASPDLLVSNSLGGAEVKCPLNHQKHLDCFTEGMHPDHMPQVQANIWICERRWWDFISFDPRTEDTTKRLYVQRIKRDPAYIEQMEAKATQFWKLYMEGATAPTIPNDVPKFF